MLMSSQMSDAQLIDPVADHLALSMPEIGALATRTARGAGFSWGMAEEAGYAAIWLAQYGFNWADIMLNRLNGARGAHPVPAKRKWLTEGASCALHAGVTLAEFAGLPEGPLGDGVTIGTLLDPLCFLPFAARAAQITGASLDLFGDGILWAEFGSCHVRLAARSANNVDAATIRLVVSHDAPTQITACSPAATAGVTKATYARLEALALHMTVPSTEQSKAGAGSVFSDND
jgi:hypothetical protein